MGPTATAPGTLVKPNFDQSLTSFSQVKLLTVRPTLGPSVRGVKSGRSSVWAGVAIPEGSIPVFLNLIEFFLYFGSSGFLDVASPREGDGLESSRAGTIPATYVPIIQGFSIREDLVFFGNATSKIGVVADVVEDFVFVEACSISSSFGAVRFVFIGHGFCVDAQGGVVVVEPLSP